MKLMNNQPGRSRLIVRTLAVGFVAFQISAVAAHASDIVYNVDTTISSSYPSGHAQTDTVLGTITTDGTIGVLASNNIVGYSLNLIDDLDNANNFLLTPADSMIIENYGGGLSASSTALSFDYSGSGEFAIQNSSAIFSGSNYLCFSAAAGACLAGETIAPQYYSGDGVDLVLSGSQPLNTATSATPEPSTCTLLLTGLIAVGGAARRKLRF